jgi:hypothetical protein
MIFQNNCCVISFLIISLHVAAYKATFADLEAGKTNVSVLNIGPSIR